MAKHELLLFPDPRLKQVSTPVKEITDEIRELASEMLEIMYDEPGVGLAAPQIGQFIRMVVVDTDWTQGEEGEIGNRNPLVLINPEIVAEEGKITWEEGCLSVPDFSAEVERSARVTLKALDLQGEEIKYEAEELQAVCFQHELDHLDGVLFIDRISRLKRNMYTKRRMKALKREEEENRAEVF